MPFFQPYEACNPNGYVMSVSGRVRLQKFCRTRLHVALGECAAGGSPCVASAIIAEANRDDNGTAAP